MRRILGLCLLIAVAAAAQTITGTIIGSVKDPSGLAVAGASVTLTQAATGGQRQARTNEQGDFVFSSLQPGEYSVAVVSTGFKRYEKRGVVLSASETLPVGDLTLEVGAVAETVTVTAEGAVVQTASAERSGLVTGSQVENLLIKGRNVHALLQLLPGVVDLADDDSPNRNFNIYVQGNRRNTNAFMLDGMSLNAIGNNFNVLVGVSQDAVAEVKILLTNYQAEFGRMSGANVQIVTKSGTREFHGLGSYFKRHEQFNANNFFSNRLGVGKPRYRFNTWNYNLGGPVYIPGKFNRDRDKLFFFWAQEYWPQKVSRPVGQLTVPTELERAGDFSQSLDLNNRLITVTDPTTARPFPDNRVPASRIEASGQALLKVFPAPNFFDRGLSAGRYNYVFQTDNNTPQRTETLKLDYHLNSNNLLFGNYTAYSDVQEGAIGIPSSGGTNWPQMRKTFNNQGKAFIGRYQRIFSPTLINELSVGFIHRPADDVVNDEEVRRNQRDTVGFKVGQFSPDTNPLKMIPNATYGGVTSAANLTIEGRFPLRTTHDSITVTNNLTKTLGAHTIKGGNLPGPHLAQRLQRRQFQRQFRFRPQRQQPAGHRLRLLEWRAGHLQLLHRGLQPPLPALPGEQHRMVPPGQLESDPAPHAGLRPALRSGAAAVRAGQLGFRIRSGPLRRGAAGAADRARAGEQPPGGRASGDQGGLSGCPDRGHRARNRRREQWSGDDQPGS